MTPDSKPLMSRHEASWHEHLAGMRAAEAARAQGGNPAATEALASATAGPVEIGGYKLNPAGQGTVWTLQRLAREFAVYADLNHLHPSLDPDSPGNREMLEIGLATLAFCDSRATWQALDSGGLPGLIVKADAMMWDMPIETQLALQAHFTAQMDRVQKLSQGEDPDMGKSRPPAGNGPSPAAPIPAPETASPASSGITPNTESPSPPSSGTPPS